MTFQIGAPDALTRRFKGRNLFKKLTVRCLKTIWALFATTVVLLAVVISLLKFSLPYADDYKADIETYLYDEFGANVQIGAIGASWQKLGPVILLQDLSLEASAAAPLDISIKETRIEVDFWQSLGQQKLVTGAFLLDGVQSQIDSSVFFKVRPQTQGNQLFESLSHLFLSQIQQFKVVDSVVVVNHEDGQAQDFQIDNLTWANEGNRHQGQGEVFVDGFSNNSLTVLVDLYGQRRGDIFGQIYLEASKIDVTPWLAQLVGDHIEVTSTEANFAVWGEVKNGLIESVLLDIDNSGLNWRKHNEQKFFNVQSAKVQWWQSDENWLLFGNQLQLQTEEFQPKPFNFTMLKGETESQLQINQVELSAITQLFSLFSATKELSILADSQLSGNVESFQLEWGEDIELAGQINVSDFSFLPQVEQGEAYLGVKGLTLNANLLSNQIWLTIAGENGKLETQDTFDGEVDYDALLVKSLLKFDEQGLDILVPTLRFKNSEVEAQLSTHYSTRADGHLSLYAEVQGPTQGNINKYLPRYLIGPNTYSYLYKAIEQGRGELTKVLIDGKTNQLPFGDATFIVDAQLKDGIFKFNETWPAIENFDARLVVDKSLMSIYGQAGAFSSLPIQNDIQADIELQSDAPLHLALTPEKLLFADFHSLVDNTPLNDILGDVFDFVRLDGSGKAAVEIDIPLDYTPNELGEEPSVVAKGQIDASGASMSMPSLLLDFKQVDAKVTFNNETFNVVSNQAELFDLPVDIQVGGRQESDGYKITGLLTSQWQGQTIKDLYPLPINEYFEGDVDTSVKVEVSLQDETYQYFVAGKVDTTDVEYDIAGPLNKKRGDRSAIDITVTGDEQENWLYASVDQQAYFTSFIPTENARMDRVRLALGEESDGLPDQGFDILLNTSSIAFEPTLDFVLKVIDSLPESQGNEPGFIDTPSLVKGNIEQVEILGQTWNNTSLNALPKDDHWLFSVGAQQTLTNVKVYNDIDERGIEIAASFLDINVESDEESGYQPAIAENSGEFIQSLPKIALVCEECRFNEKPLGKVELVASPVGQNLIIEKAGFNYKRTSFDATGTWYGDEKAGRTELNAKLNSRFLGDWLKEWQLDTGIKDSDGQMDLDVNWQGAPHDFAYQNLNGAAKFRLGEGYLSEINDKGVRIISILSLDSLYRKLKFDFSDVFEKGLFYNDIKGDLVIKNGVVHSDNIMMDGVAGNMEMQGETNLVDNTLDYNVSFKPKVTSSIPVIAGFLANFEPVTFLSLLALNQVIEEAVVVSELRMTVQGDIAEPEVTEVERFTRKVKVPQPEPQPDIELRAETEEGSGQ